MVTTEGSQGLEVQGRSHASPGLPHLQMGERGRQRVTGEGSQCCAALGVARRRLIVLPSIVKVVQHKSARNRRPAPALGAELKQGVSTSGCQYES